MLTSEIKPKILLVGNDSMLSYLIKRYADQIGLDLEYTTSLLPIAEVVKIRPTHILFTSLLILKKSQFWIGTLLDLELHILVCSGIGEEPAARDFGADTCLIHPITFDDFQKALI